MSDAWRLPGYAELKELGKGGTGSVIMAQDANGTPVAIKYLNDKFAGDQQFKDAFRAEAELLGQLDSPHVVRLHEFVESEYGAAIVMQMVEGASLRALLSEHGATEPESALVVLKGSLLGLQVAHAKGVVHRDYKPDNVLITGEGQSLLADFGIALRSGGLGDGLGTPWYMPPEQWAYGIATPLGDVYSATATFVECLLGRPPFEANSLPALREQHEEAPVPVDELPEAVRALAQRGMAKDPEARPANAGEFLADLELAAVLGFGEDWEEKGKRDLGRRAGPLIAAAGLLALGSGATTSLVGGTALAATALGGTAAGGAVSSAFGSIGLGTAKGKALAGTVVALVIAGAAVIIVTTTGSRTEAAAAISVVPPDAPRSTVSAPVTPAPAIPPASVAPAPVRGGTGPVGTGFGTPGSGTGPVRPTPAAEPPAAVPGDQGPGDQGPGNQGPGNQGPGNEGPGNEGPGNGPTGTETVEPTETGTTEPTETETVEPTETETVEPTETGTTEPTESNGPTGPTGVSPPTEGNGFEGGLEPGDGEGSGGGVVVPAGFWPTLFSGAWSLFGALTGPADTGHTGS